MWTLFICERHSICVPVAHFLVMAKGRVKMQSASPERTDDLSDASLPDVPRLRMLVDFINGGPGMGMNAIQQASLEIREHLKHMSMLFLVPMLTNLGDRIQIIVLGATDLEAGMTADVAPVTEQVIGQLQVSPRHPIPQN